MNTHTATQPEPDALDWGSPITFGMPPDGAPPDSAPPTPHNGEEPGHDFADELAALRTPKAPAAPQPADIIESNGRRFVRTGETRDPKAGEWFIGSNGIADEAFIDFDQWAFPILREIAPVGAA